MQAHVRFAVLCPARLPRATRGWRQTDRPPALRADILGSPGHPRLPTAYGLEFGYSAPVEPQSGRLWRQMVWHNRPCCFLHFTVYAPKGAPLPPGLTPVILDGKHGLIKYATGYGLQGSSGYYWANHTWFFWREHGVRYAASLHYFGAGTTQLLGRLIRELRPAADLRP